MKKKIIFRLGVFACILAISGCTPMNDKEMKAFEEVEGQKSDNNWLTEIEKLKKIKPSDLPKNINIKVSDGLLVDADISVSSELEDYQVSGLKLKQNLFDVDKDLDRLLNLLGNPKVVKREENVSDEVMADDETFLRINSAYFDNDTFVQVRDRRFMVCGRTNTPYEISTVGGYYSSLFSFPDGVMEELYLENIELDFMKVDSAKEKAKHFMEDMGVNDICNVRCFSCEESALQEEVEKNLLEMKECGLEENELPKCQKVSKEDEGYYIVAQQGYQGVPYLPVSVDQSLNNTYSLSGTRIELLMTNKGIVDAEVSDLFEVESSGEKMDILSPGDILESFIELHNDKTSRVQSVVKHIGLYYLPILDNKEKMSFNAYPVYCVIYNQPSTDTDGINVREYNIFDAMTGERLE